MQDYIPSGSDDPNGGRAANALMLMAIQEIVAALRSEQAAMTLTFAKVMQPVRDGWSRGWHARGLRAPNGSKEDIDPADRRRYQLGSLNARRNGQDTWFDVALLFEDIVADFPDPVHALTRIAAKQSRKRGGRPSKVNWEAIGAALDLEIRNRGLPDLENPVGWRTQADAEKWVADLLEARNEPAAASTVRDRVRRMLSDRDRKPTET
jgi:hypothetical protein